MRCPNCQKLILNNTAVCPFCGQAVAQSSNEKPMFEQPTNPVASPVGANPVPSGVPHAEHHEAVHREVKKRHWQRWLFYALLIVVVLGAIGLTVITGNNNAKLMKEVSDLQANLTSKTQEVASAQEKAAEALERSSVLQAELDLKATQYRQEIELQANAGQDLGECRLALSAADANVYNLILELGSGMSSADLMRIPVADSNLDVGLDSDGDGLSDEVEASFGTDPNNPDTDGDGYSDKEEILAGFNPLIPGESLPIDQGFADSQRGKILLQVDGNNEAWYVSPSDGKRYFMGRPGDGYKAMRSIEFWTKNFSKNE